jgi:potassium channel subfamily K
MEGWHIMTSLYVITQIVTTVGYGDMTIHNPSSKIFISFYLMALMVLGSYYLNRFAQKLVDANQEKLEERLRRLRQGHHHLSIVTDDVGRLVGSGVVFALMLLFGTVFYANYEACTCSYGRAFVEGCKEPSWKDPKSWEVCKDTGGYVKGYTESWYMSVVTLLTVGFGDHTPRSYIGRGVGIVWISIGVMCAANFIGAMSEFFFHSKANRDFMKAMEMSEETFNKIDVDKSGTLQRGEFLTFALQNWGLVPADVLDELNMIYDKMDGAYGGEGGGVTFADIKNIAATREKRKQSMAQGALADDTATKIPADQKEDP